MPTPFMPAAATVALLLLTTPALYAQEAPAAAAPTTPAALAPVLATEPAPATMFKLGLDAPRMTGGYWGFSAPLYGGVERQLGQHFSFTADLNANIGLTYRFISPVALTNLGVSLGGRYYYSQARRARKGKAVAPLSGTYLQLQYSSELEGYYSFGYDGPYHLSYRHRPGADVLWGYQRRLGKHGFTDLGAGLRFTSRDVYTENWGTRQGLGIQPVLRARIGLAF